MFRARRLTLLVLVAVIGTLALGGCRSDPSTAAYIGSRQVSVSHIDRLVDEVADAVEQVDGQQAQSELNLAALRQLIVSSMVIEDVGRRVAADQRVSLPPTDTSLAAQVLGLPANSPMTSVIMKTELAGLIADTYTMLNALAGSVQPVDPTEAEQREVYGNLRLEGEPPPFEEVRQYLTTQSVGRELGLRRLLAAGVERHHVVVNPRYAPLAFQVPIQLGQVPAFVSIPIVDR